MTTAEDIFTTKSKAVPQTGAGFVHSMTCSLKSLLDGWPMLEHGKLPQGIYHKAHAAIYIKLQLPMGL